MNDAKDEKSSEGNGGGETPKETTPVTGPRDREPCGGGGQLASSTTGLLKDRVRQGSGIKVILKRVMIAVGLVVVCWGILMAQKSYGVWVLSGIAVVLVILGLLRKETKPADSSEEGDAAGDGKKA